MTKFNEITNETERRSKLNYVKELWTGWRQVRETTLTRINSYLFTLNAGALLASLTYVAAKKIMPTLIFQFAFSLLEFCSLSYMP